MIEIRFAKLEDIENIIDFLRQNWSENSILVKSMELFNFQYVRDNVCTFVIAIDDENEIFGIKGYFNFNDEKSPDIAAALAIVKQGVRPMLGMEIQKFLEEKTNSRWICATGLNPNTSVRVYKLFSRNYTVDKLQHYYRLNDCVDYKVANIVSKKILPVQPTSKALKDISDFYDWENVFDFDAYRDIIPFKNQRYFEYRYINHPFYQYKIYGIFTVQSEVCETLVVARECTHNNVSVLRIVDILGDRELIGEVGLELDRIMVENGYEYVDIYCYGLDRIILESAGFSLKDESDANIIPNYFEPFVQKNVDVYFFYTGKEKRVICRADGDQDRPNIIPSKGKLNE